MNYFLIEHVVWYWIACHAWERSFFKTVLPIALCSYVISPSVKYLSDRKIACPMDPIDPSDICHACKPSCFKAVLPSALQLHHLLIINSLYV